MLATGMLKLEPLPTFVCVGPWMTLKGEWIVPLKCRIDEVTDMGFLFRRGAYGGDRNRLS